ncbi:MAG: hypothetical protein AAF587_21325 [Bacteroidota bacterium]
MTTASNKYAELRLENGTVPSNRNPGDSLHQQRISGIRERGELLLIPDEAHSPATYA